MRNTNPRFLNADWYKLDGVIIMNEEYTGLESGGFMREVYACSSGGGDTEKRRIP